MKTMIYYEGIFCLLLAALVAISVPLIISDERKRKRQIKSAFAGREPLDDHTFFQKHFASRGIPEDVVSRIRRLLANDLEVDISRIRPEDDFTGNLQFFFQHDQHVSVYIVQDLEKEFGISITDDEAARRRTVNDIVIATWTKLRQRAA